MASDTVVTIKHPDQNVSEGEKTAIQQPATGLTTLNSHSDSYPHYLMAITCK
jgi:hypothetical protein